MIAKRLQALLFTAGIAIAASAAAVDLQELRRAIEGAAKGNERKEQPAAGSQKSDASDPAQQASGKKERVDLSNILSAVRGLSVEEEIAIGRQISGNLLGAAPLVQDEALQAYVNRVGRWVAAQSSRSDLKWTFGVIDSADINAFAAPGGYVFITRGLYARLQDEAQLAGVLGHEIAHVQQKHHLKVLQQQQLVNLGSQAMSRKLKGEEAIRKVIGSGAEIMARGLDKSAEFEADRMGVVLAARAGYDAFGLATVLQDLGTSVKDAGSVALLFKTHPHPDERLNALSEAMGERFDNAKGGKTLPERLVRLR